MTGSHMQIPGGSVHAPMDWALGMLASRGTEQTFKLYYNTTY